MIDGSATTALDCVTITSVMGFLFCLFLNHSRFFLLFSIFLVQYKLSLQN